ncbi:hypothetical protein F8E02_03815 [Methanoculleus sp. Wushi-C6]|uniref:protein adenylyltransferase n=1 Tax=Methanoculleus caldifontis TaxID=2651577 RepID=A0ABU3WZB8_9EURY|nr:nucleotidyltransferase domain-containing protein [Methanoculleus sp. Wushi-C6]MDV2481150.1 hypothetical protein [Methanoculleus sp. Wushi-C6]
MHPLTRIRLNLRTIRERYGVARIGIFGSVARNEATAASDIDILVEFREGEETFDAPRLAALELLPVGASPFAPGGAHAHFVHASHLRCSNSVPDGTSSFEA